MHRLFSTNFPQIRALPRIFLYDCCDGSHQRDIDWATGDDETTDEEEKKDMTKNFDAENLKIARHDGKIWKLGQLNPDYNLCEIHGANEGFQAKISQKNGSYLISQFITQINDNCTWNWKDESIISPKIMDALANIQEDLHSAGKQQIVFTTNNETRSLQFSHFPRWYPYSKEDGFFDCLDGKFQYWYKIKLRGDECMENILKSRSKTACVVLLWCLASFVMVKAPNWMDHEPAEIFIWTIMSIQFIACLFAGIHCVSDYANYRIKRFIWALSGVTAVVVIVLLVLIAVTA